MLDHVSHLEAIFILWGASIVFLLLVGLYLYINEKRKKK